MSWNSLKPANAAAAIALAFVTAVPLMAPPAHATTVAQPNAAARALPDFSALVETQGPAVVNISTMQRNARTQTPQGTPSDPLQEFFRRFPQSPNGPAQRGVGSGFIVSPDGFILTNAHVVADASEVIVRLTDKREFKAKVVGTDRRTDVAVIRIDAQNLPTVRIGDTSRLRVGEWVAAIGSPFGFDNTVTAGIVSAKSRALPDDSFVPFIQTDVAINPGNSGGPLFNLNGEVVGINSQIYSRSGGYQGLSFAIPIDVAMRVKDDLVKYGKVTRGRIGVTIQPVTNELAESFGLAKAGGALVNAVEAGGPADKAGVKSGDVILQVDGKPVEQSVDLPRLIGEGKPGQSVTLQVVRNGERRDLRVTIGELPTERMARAGTDPQSKPAPAAKTGRLGLAVRPLTSDEKQQLDGASGVMVEQVDGPAARAGIQAGDVIVGINNQPIQSVDELRELVAKSKVRIALLVQRQGTRLYVPIRLG
jgi:serine protease Do